MVASKADIFQKDTPIGRRGNRNVTKWYLKEATYTTVGDNTGYFVNYKGVYVPIEFYFINHFWYLVKDNKQRSSWVSNYHPTEDNGLNIQEDKVVDRSKWGPLDGEQSDPKLHNKSNLFIWVSLACN